MKPRKGIILAGGSGTRLYPITLGLSKQLLPVYDKPMIFYPISTLMLAGIREIAVITTPHDQAQFQSVLKDGSQWGVSFEWIVQDQPEGLAQAYILARDFLAGAPSALILGDNIFFGHGLTELLKQASASARNTIFGYQVRNPECYGVAGFAPDGSVSSIVEKPKSPASNLAITGLYFLDESAPDLADQVEPSARGELEITTLLEMYLKMGQLAVEKLGRGFAWLDTGTHASLLDAGNFVRTLEDRQGLQTGCLEEIAFHQGWIDAAHLRDRARLFAKNDYGLYLQRVLLDAATNEFNLDTKAEIDARARRLAV
ncbi:glucose-1-phosphate thymidylyltransferase RfbA [Litoreibacter janthinus]|uniref:Glucose-1-phosphate thymidylyltransferase n=1 Tax=Litoreibacter janthinus TaxID=670154 RepID=A0A1I6IDR4_9RHOB|nr:glucose-1-phosphate thymidylyltransferase RfbA [Litoreibacter janthinus]SFR64500.1 Glucose-1-phosphate thymidylyltransferase [Litoreibacter janthinus]